MVIVWGGRGRSRKRRGSGRKRKGYSVMSKGLRGGGRKKGGKQRKEGKKMAKRTKKKKGCTADAMTMPMIETAKLTQLTYDSKRVEWDGQVR